MERAAGFGEERGAARADGRKCIVLKMYVTKDLLGAAALSKFEQLSQCKIAVTSFSVLAAALHPRPFFIHRSVCVVHAMVITEGRDCTFPFHNQFTYLLLHIYESAAAARLSTLLDLNLRRGT